MNARNSATNNGGAKPVYAKEISEFALTTASPESPAIRRVWEEYGIYSARNVSEWTTTKNDDGVERRSIAVGFFDRDSVQIGRADITNYEPPFEGFTHSVKISGINHHDLQIDIDDSTGVVRMQDLTTGRTGNITPDYNKKQFNKDDTAEEILSPAGESALILSAAVYFDVTVPKELMGHDVTPGSCEENNQNIGQNQSALSYVCCGGGLFYTRATAGLRSYCCYDAQLKTAGLCSNRYCYGCCAYRGCDAWCMVGDMHCVCGILGQACSVCHY